MIRAVPRAAVAVALGCSGSPGPGGAVEARITVEALPVNALSARVVVEADEPVRATLRVIGPDREWDAPPAGAPSRRIELHALGMRPETEYRLVVTLDAPGAGRAVVDRVFRSGALPASFPRLTVLEAAGDPAVLTAFAALRVEDPRPHAEGVAFLVVLDGAGEVVWYAEVAGAPTAVRLDEHGIWWIVQPRSVERLTVIGERLAPIHPDGGVILEAPEGSVAVPVETLHHDLIVLERDRALALGTRSRWLGPEECPGYDARYRVVGDVVVELDVTRGAVDAEWSLFDVMDPCEADTTSFNDRYYGDLYGPEAADWTHSNSVALDAERDALIVSVRHASQVVALRRRDGSGGKAGDVLWRLGEGGDFTLAGEGAEWFRLQHAARPLPDDRIVLYDNGAPLPGEAPGPPGSRRSRAVEYRLDGISAGAAPGRAEQVWEWSPLDGRRAVGSDGVERSVPFYAPILGGAIPTPQGTVLVTHGSLLEPFDAPQRTLARVVEVTHDADHRVVLDVEVGGSPTLDGWVVYRAVRPASVYGGPGAY